MKERPGFYEAADGGGGCGGGEGGRVDRERVFVKKSDRFDPQAAAKLLDEGKDPSACFTILAIMKKEGLEYKDLTGSGTPPPAR